MGSWSDASRDILQAIAEKINHHSDFAHFGAVCKSWRSVFMENRHHLPQKLPICLCYPHQLAVPLLLRSGKKDIDSHEFCLPDGKVYDGFFLPEATNKWICGSSWGWLVMVDIDGEGICLLNPITRAQIQLPPLGSSTERAIISADPSTHSSDCVVLAIAGNFRALFYCRVGDTKWTKIKESPWCVQDIIYHEGKFFAIDKAGVVVAFNSSSPDAVGAIVVGEQSVMLLNEEYTMMKYLVMSSGVLLKVVKVVDQVTSETIKFKVSKQQKIDSPIGRNIVCVTLGGFRRQRRIFYKWVNLESLDDQMLLLGTNSSISLPAYLFPNFKSGCIYFTNDFVWQPRRHPFFGLAEGQHDAGIFDVSEGSFQSYCLNDRTPLMPSVWVIPNIW